MAIIVINMTKLDALRRSIRKANAAINELVLVSKVSIEKRSKQNWSPRKKAFYELSIAYLMLLDNNLMMSSDSIGEIKSAVKDTLTEFRYILSLHKTDTDLSVFADSNGEIRSAVQKMLFQSLVFRYQRVLDRRVIDPKQFPRLRLRKIIMLYCRKSIVYVGRNHVIDVSRSTILVR